MAVSCPHRCSVCSHVIYFMFTHSFHFIYITYRKVALQPQLIFKGPLILQEIKLISKILKKSNVHMDVVFVHI